MKDLFIEDYELVYLFVEGESICKKCDLIDTKLCESKQSSACLYHENAEKAWKLKQKQNETNN